MMKYIIFAIVLVLNMIKYFRTNEKIYIMAIIFIDFIIIYSIKIDYDLRKEKKKFEADMKSILNRYEK